MRPRRIAWLVLALSPVMRSPGIGGGGEATYLIVEKPAALVVYDRYQQSLDERARRTLPRFLPVRVLSQREFLSDRLTPCMSVEIQGSPYYLLLDSGNELSGSASAGRLLHIKRADPLNDTVAVIRNGRLKFEQPSDGRQQTLQAGEKLARVFSLSGRTYVWRKATSSYGWVEVREKEKGSLWIPSVRAPASRETIDLSRLQDSVRSRLSAVNHLLSRIFSHFNNDLHLERVPPQWTFHASGDTVICQLEGTSTPDDYEESTAVLSRNLSDLVIGTRFTVVTAPGKITFRPG